MATQIAADLLDSIHTDRMKPGDVLPAEVELARRYGVSRPVVREALRSLQGQGYLESVPGHGSVIRSPAPEVLQNLFTWIMRGDTGTWIDLHRVRRVLESESARWAALNHTPQTLASIREALERMAEHTGDVEEYNRFDIRFHVAIAEASENTFLIYLIESIRSALMTILRSLRYQLPRELIPAVQQAHERIYTAIARRDGEGAVRTMGQHFDDVIERIRRCDTDGGPVP
ncbi:MAG: FadR family transcriptional regulator [Spirochaetales bacterium]|nr:FadR family transcriptional regulator [Spirochaetales bacterium]